MVNDSHICEISGGNHVMNSTITSEDWKANSFDPLRKLKSFFFEGNMHELKDLNFH